MLDIQHELSPEGCWPHASITPRRAGAVLPTVGLLMNAASRQDMARDQFCAQ